MKRKKALLSMCMVAAMTGTTMMPVLAAGGGPSKTAEEQIKLQDNMLEYGELELLIHEYNVSVINNRVAYRKAEVDTPPDLSEVHWTAARNAIEAAEAAREASDAALGDVKAKEAAARAEAAAQQAVGRAENNTDSLETTRLSYEKAEKSILMQAQATMNTYHQLQMQLEPLKKNRDLLEAVLQSVQTKHGNGMAVQSEVLTAQQKLKDIDVQIAGMEAQIRSVKQKLGLMTGWPANGNPEIVSMPETDMSRITTMNVEQDTVKAMEQDYALKINQMKLKNSGSLESSQMIEQTIANDKQQIAAAVNTAYQNTLQAKAAYDQAVLDYDIEAKNMNTADIKYNQGIISRLEHLQVQSAFASAKAGVDVKNLALFQAIETYDWTVKGVR